MYVLMWQVRCCVCVCVCVCVCGPLKFSLWESIAEHLSIRVEGPRTELVAREPPPSLSIPLFISSSLSSSTPPSLHPSPSLPPHLQSFRFNVWSMFINRLSRGGREREGVREIEREWEWVRGRAREGEKGIERECVRG